MSKEGSKYIAFITKDSRACGRKVVATAYNVSNQNLPCTWRPENINRNTRLMQGVQFATG